MRTRQHALGQNFLHHKPTITKIAALVASEILEIGQLPKRPKTLLEVGPGKLALTHALIPIAIRNTLPMVLVERDRYLEEGIRQGVVNEKNNNITLYLMDAATEKFTNLIDELKNSGQTPLYFASNLPYSASSKILANLCYRSSDICGATIMVQKELAQRMAAQAGTADRGAFSLLIQSYFEVQIAFDVGPGAFSPPPKVKSTVLKLRPLAAPATTGLDSPKKFEHFCKMLFSQRRKMIRNMIPPEKHELFPKLGISGTERPEVLSLNTVVELYKAIS